jgi:hypothetical protein
LRFIKEYIEEKLLTIDSKDLAPILKVSVSMLSSYKTQGYRPSLTVAKTVYTLDKVVLHPFSEESLQFEISKGK